MKFSSFTSVLVAARRETWCELVCHIEWWIHHSKEARRAGCWGVLNTAYSNTLLSVVVLESSVEVVKKIDGLVCFYGAQVEIPGSMIAKRSMFMKSVMNMRSDAAMALLLLGADPDMTYDPWRKSAYVYAAEHNLIDIVKTMTLCEADIYQTDELGHNALVVAVKRGHVELAKHVLEHAMTPNWHTFIDHMTLLHWAVSNLDATSTAMVKFLLDKGANPHLRKFNHGCFSWDSPGTGFTPIEFLMDQANKSSTTTSFDQDEIVVIEANAKLLKDKMREDVANRNLAFCMVSNERLSSNPKCLLESLCGEASLLHMIMDKVVESFDIDYPENALPPNDMSDFQYDQMLSKMTIGYPIHNI
jgi:hypothetical protein